MDHAQQRPTKHIPAYSPQFEQPAEAGSLTRVDRYAKVIIQDPTIVIVSDEVISTISQDPGRMAIPIPDIPQEEIRPQVAEAVERLKAEVPGIRDLTGPELTELARRLGMGGSILYRRSSIKDPQISYHFKHELFHVNARRDKEAEQAFKETAPMFEAANAWAFRSIFLGSNYYGRLTPIEVWAQYAYPTGGSAEDWDDLRASIRQAAGKQTPQGRKLKGAMEKAEFLRRKSEEETPELLRKIRLNL